MSRTKSTPRSTPAFPKDQTSGISRTARTSTSPKTTQIRASEHKIGLQAGHELALSTDWTTPLMAVRKTQLHNRDLVKAGRIIDAALLGNPRTTEGERVDRAALDWAQAVGLKEKGIQEAKELRRKEKAREAFDKAYPTEKRTGKQS